MNVASKLTAGSAMKPLLVLLVVASGLLSACGKDLSDKDYIERAKEQQDKGEIRASMIELKNALEKNPQNPEARWLLGLAYLKLEQGSSAEGEFKRAKELGISDDALNAPVAEALLLQQKYQRVLDEIKLSGNESPPQKARILHLRGNALAGLGRLPEACALYEESLKVDGSYVPAYLGLANCSYTNGKFDEARNHIQAALKVDPKNADSWILLGDLEKVENNLEAAEADYANALKEDPRKIIALFNQATLRVSKGDIESAQQRLKQIREIDPKHYLGHYLQALLDFTNGKTDTALEATARTLKAKPDNLSAYLLLGILQYNKGSYEQAGRTLSQYLDLVPGSLPARKTLAATYLKLENPDKTLALLKPLLTLKLNDPQLFALAAQAHMQLRDPDAAATLYAQAAEILPNDASLLTELGLSRLQSGDTAGALRELERAAQGNDKEFKPDFVLALYYLRDNQPDRALEILRELEKKAPDNPVVHDVKGVAYGAKKDFVEARKSFEQALALNPLDITAAHYLAILDLGENKPERARKRFENILAKDKSNVGAMIELARLAENNQQEKEFLSWLERAAKIDAKALPPRKMLVDYYLRQDRPDKALVVARETLDANPKLGAALDLLGTTQLAVGQTENAVTSFNQLVRLEPDSAVAHYRLGIAQQSLKRWDAARASLRQSLAKRPVFPAAQQALASLEVAAGNSVEALRLAQEMQKQQPESPMGFALEGDVHLNIKNYAKAAAAYQKAAALENTNTLAIKRHQALSLAGDEKAASAHLKQWMAGRPQDLAVHAYLASHYLNTGRNKEAIAEYEFLLTKAPNDPRLLNNLAWLYQLQNDTRALPTVERAVELAPDNPQFQDTFGWILVQQGNFDRARDVLAKAATKSPSPSIRYHYATALARSGDKDGAKRELTAVLKSGAPFPEKAQAEALLRGL